MKIARLGEFGKEKPAVIINDAEAVFVDDVISDWNRTELENGALDKVKKLDLSARPKIKFADYRLGSPVARPTKAICIGLNYTQHAIETNAPIPQEPIVFMKAPDTVIGGNDTIIIPPNSVKTDYEVEICVVIGKRALYLKSPEEARDYILGFTISQDVSERYWQVERGGQWVKGKSFPTFNPVGPWIITADEMKNEQNLRLWCEVDGEMRQDSNTSDMIFNIAHCVWYVSQVMELMPGDIINTGTPQGVGMGFKPEKFLKGGETVRTGIDGIGVLTSQVKKHS